MKGGGPEFLSLYTKMPFSQKCMRGCEEVFKGDKIQEVADMHEEHLRQFHSDVAFKKEMKQLVKHSKRSRKKR